MLLSYKWLKQYTKVPWSPVELAERLTTIGMKVESVTEATDRFPHIVVGEITAVDGHDADGNLTVCSVDIGAKTITVVTGAPNAAVGLRVPTALSGAVVGDLKIAAVEFNGVTSEGMLCSEHELGLGDDESGIMILPPDAAVGNNLSAELGDDDPVLELELYPNRPDCQSVIGIAREVAAITREEIQLPTVYSAEDDSEGPAVPVFVDAPDVCPRYAAQIVENVTIGPSPSWMQRFLRAAGMRPINNVVDVTNFVMLETGQPLHAFDVTVLAGPEIRVRHAASGEKMITLDGVERELTPEMLVIADAEKPVAIAGVMGGENSEVTAATTTVLLEAATFNPVSVRRTARTLGLQTEASLRFERGLDPHLPVQAIARAAHLLTEIAGGRPSPVVSDVHEALPEGITLHVRPERVNRILGTDLAAADMKWLLRALHFTVDSVNENRLQVTVPTFRRDINMEIDLIEEIARLHGFQNIEATLPRGASIQGRQTLKLNHMDRLRDRLVAAGLMEAVTYAFMSDRGLQDLGVAADHAYLQAMRLLNPITEELTHMRTTLIPNMLGSLSRNARRQANRVHLFELGSVYVAKQLPVSEQPDELPVLTIGLLGAAANIGWGEKERDVDFYDLKGLVEHVADVFAVVPEFQPFSDAPFHPGRAAALVVDGQQIGVLGEINPQVAERFGLNEPAYVAEIQLTPLLSLEPHVQARPVARFPAIRRDLALVVPKEVHAAQIEHIMRREGDTLLTDLELFDVYAGAQVPDGYHSLAYALTWQAYDRTLTEHEINVIQERILKMLQTKYDITVRS